MLDDVTLAGRSRSRGSAPTRCSPRWRCRPRPVAGAGWSTGLGRRRAGQPDEGAAGAGLPHPAQTDADAWSAPTAATGSAATTPSTRSPARPRRGGRAAEPPATWTGPATRPRRGRADGGVDATTDRSRSCVARRARRRRGRLLLGRALPALGTHAEALAAAGARLADDPDDEACSPRCCAARPPCAASRPRWTRYERLPRAGPRPARHRPRARRCRRCTPSCWRATARCARGCSTTPPRLIGRDDDVAALRGDDPRPRGSPRSSAPGGLGKTRLAHVMGRLAEQPVVHFVELAGVTSPRAWPPRSASALGVRESVADRRLLGRGPRADLRRPDRRADRQHADAADPRQLRARRRGGRRPGRDAGRPDAGAAGAHHHPGAARPRRRARLPAAAARPATTPSSCSASGPRPRAPAYASTTSGSRALVDRLDGLPLAVELAAAKVRVMSVEEIERRLEDRFALLRGGSRDGARAAPDPARGHRLELEPARRRGARSRCAGSSVFRDGFSLERCRRGGRRRRRRSTWSTRLVDQSLVVVHEGDGELRYRLLETVREFGRMQLVEAGDEPRGGARCCASWAVALRRRRRRPALQPATRSRRWRGSGPRRATSLDVLTPLPCADARRRGRDPGDGGALEHAGPSRATTSRWSTSRRGVEDVVVGRRRTRRARGRRCATCSRCSPSTP